MPVEIPRTLLWQQTTLLEGWKKVEASNSFGRCHGDY